MNKSHPICEHPRIIVNPKLPALLAEYGCYCIRGVIHNVHVKNSAMSYFHEFDYRPFDVKKNNITRDDIDNCYVISYEDGETFPIYLEVPCGHCELCRNRRVQDYVYRMRLETEMYNYKPWFVTLTYDDDNLPPCLSVRDVQLFLKRFRINLERSGYDFKIRYAAVGELGKTGKRPHYHLIIWNIHCTTHIDYTAIKLILQRSWNKGFTMCRLVDPSNDKSFYYTAKYLHKSDCKPVIRKVRDILDLNGNHVASEIDFAPRFFYLPPEVREELVPVLSPEYVMNLGDGDELVSTTSSGLSLNPNLLGFHDI